MLRHDQSRSADGTCIAFSEWGNSNGPAVVLIHGWISCRGVFSHQVEGELAERCRLVAYDLRGHGDSGKPASPEGYADQALWAQDLECVLRAVGISRPVIAGWSLGGRIAAHYVYVNGPGRVAALNLISARILQEASPSVLGPVVAGPGITSSLLAECIPETARVVRHSVEGPLTQSEFEHLFGAAMRVPPVARKGASAWHIDYGDYFDSLQIPTLVSHGTSDCFVLPAAAQEIARRLRGTLSLYADCGHMPFWESPARFNHELAELAARHWKR